MCVGLPHHRGAGMAQALTQSAVATRVWAGNTAGIDGGAIAIASRGVAHVDNSTLSGA